MSPRSNRCSLGRVVMWVLAFFAAFYGLTIWRSENSIRGVSHSLSAIRVPVQQVLNHIIEQYSRTEPDTSTTLSTKKYSSDALQLLSMDDAASAAARWLDTLPHGAWPYNDTNPDINLKKVISMSLYGSDPKYTTGALHNSAIAPHLFPEWELWFFVPGDDVTETKVPETVLDELRSNGAKIIFMDKQQVEEVGFGMNQRFLITDYPDVAIYEVRDGDSRLLLRDRWAIDQFVASNYTFHLVRDHPAHCGFFISGGMWGGRHGGIEDMAGQLKNSPYKGGYLSDMSFLNERIGGIMQQKGIMQHDSYCCKDFNGPTSPSFPFPHKRAGGELVGGVYDPLDDIRRDHTALLFPPRNPDPCGSPEYAAADRRVLHLAQAAPCKRDDLNCAGQPEEALHLVGMLSHPAGDDRILLTQLKQVFVDAMPQACETDNQAASLPAVFDYKRVLNRQRLQSDACADKDSLAIQQFDERVQTTGTHYNVFSGGVGYHRHLMMVDAAYTHSLFDFITHTWAWILYFHSAIPQHAHVLIPSTPMANASIDALLRLPFPAFAQIQDHWFNVPWLVAHRTNQVHWAHRLYIASPVGPQFKWREASLATWKPCKLANCADLRQLAALSQMVIKQQQSVQSLRRGNIVVLGEMNNAHVASAVLSLSRTLPGRTVQRHSLSALNDTSVEALSTQIHTQALHFMSASIVILPANGMTAFASLIAPDTSVVVAAGLSPVHQPIRPDFLEEFALLCNSMRWRCYTYDAPIDKAWGGEIGNLVASLSSAT